MLSAMLAVVCAPAGPLSDDLPAWSVAAPTWEASLGNHRARVRVDETADAVRVHLAWRRRDRDPEAKRVLVRAASGAEVTDVLVARMDRIAGEVVFRPTEGVGEYFVYYRPYTTQDTWGWYGGAYLPPLETGDPAWRERNGLGTGEAWERLPQAAVIGFESRTEFSRLDPMELVASEAEVAGLLERNPGRACLIFPEDRDLPIRMEDDLPVRWIERGPSDALALEAEKDEYRAFQLGVWAARAATGPLTLDFSDLVAEGGARIPAGAMHCINLGGTDWTGKPLAKEVSVAEGRVQALWCLIAVPRDAAEGAYEGTLRLASPAGEIATVRLSLRVLERVAENHGYDDLARYARLAWVDSTIAQDEEITAPYTPLTRRGASISCLGREVLLDVAGLPASIRAGETELLAEPLRFVLSAGGEVLTLEGEAPRFGHASAGAVEWTGETAGGGARLTCEGRMECDGWLHYTLRLRAERDLALDDAALELPFRAEAARYLMGIGHDGGTRPREWSWKWGGQIYHDSFWVGDVPAGLQCELRGTSYHGPMVNLYWRLGQLAPPASWNNGGAGGCTVAESGDIALARAYSGPRQLVAGEEATFEFALLITPVKPLDTARHFRERYFHDYEPVEQVAGYGANVINIHHGTDINPYINYPFLRAKELGAYVDAAHERDMRVKIYYTLREVTNHIAELPALRSLGHEVIAPGGGAGYPWLIEHLGSDYSPSWYQPMPEPGREDCASVVNSGEGRWYNYYLEGLDWLVRNVNIDGLYVDDVSYDRRVMRRVRKILDRAHEGCMVDLHSNTAFSNGPANQYMEFFPFIDRLWFGEGFDYNRPPDYWLTEISGIPYGLMGDMLQDGGNVWRGMIYGMTGRMPWSGDPRGMWAVWDRFGIPESTMLGYWDPACPVRTGREDVLATAYVREGRTLVSVASWAPEPTGVTLATDWQALGLDPSRVTLRAPAIEGFQEEASFAPDAPIPVEPGKGWVLWLEEE